MIKYQIYCLKEMEIAVPSEDYYAPPNEFQQKTVEFLVPYDVCLQFDSQEDAVVYIRQNPKNFDGDNVILPFFNLKK